MTAQAMPPCYSENTCVSWKQWRSIGKNAECGISSLPCPFASEVIPGKTENPPCSPTWERGVSVSVGQGVRAGLNGVVGLTLGPSAVLAESNLKSLLLMNDSVPNFSLSTKTYSSLGPLKIIDSFTPEQRNAHPLQGHTGPFRDRPIQTVPSTHGDLRRVQ